MTESNRMAFLEVFPAFRDASPALVDDIVTTSIFHTSPANVLLKSEGDWCEEFVFLLSGEKRVFKRSESGRRITLYEMGPGDICVLNAASILANRPLPASAESLTDVSMLLLKAEELERMVAEYELLRRFVFGRISEGFVAITTLISEVVFGRMDERLSNYLVEKSQNGALETTHQEIADDLGTSREVVSRLLKDFERQGAVSLSRSHIELLQL